MLIRLVLVAAATALTDLLCKLAALHFLAEPVILIPHVLNLQLTHNTGMALGLLAGNRIAGVLLPVLVCVVTWLQLRQYEPTKYIRTAEGLILGGFFGNFVERILYGAVTDMLFFPFLPWFVCNVADVAICFGVALIIISLIFRPQDWREKLAKDKPADPE